MIVDEPVAVRLPAWKWLVFLGWLAHAQPDPVGIAKDLSTEITDALHMSEMKP